MNLVDSSLCMGRLQSAAHFNYEEAKVLYGVYGKAQTLFNMPAAFITPLTISIVPAISGAIVRRENDEATKISEDSMRIAAVLSLPMGVGLAVPGRAHHAPALSRQPSPGPGCWRIMGVAAFFVCMVLMENAILQASGKEMLPMITMIVGGVVKVVINYFLVANRGINIYGAPIGTLVSYFVMALMNYVFMCSCWTKTRSCAILLKPWPVRRRWAAFAWAVLRPC